MKLFKVKNFLAGPLHIACAAIHLQIAIDSSKTAKIENRLAIRARIRKHAATIRSYKG